MLALLKGDFFLDGRHRNGDGHDDGGHQLHGGGGHIEAQRHSHDKTVQAAAEHHADDAAQHGALAKQCLADDEGCQCDGHHAGAHIDITALLILRQQAAGEGAQCAGNAQAHRDGEGRVDAGSAHHGSVVTGGADGQAQPGAEEAQHRRTGKQDHGQRDGQLIPAAKEAQ